MTLMVLKSFALSQNSVCISCHLIALLFHVLSMLRSDFVMVKLTSLLGSFIAGGPKRNER